jgi:hypothetical protein
VGRKAETKLFEYRKLSSPHNGNQWHLIQGRPTGKRERYYFEPEKEAKKAAATRNLQITAFGLQTTLSDSYILMQAE